MKMKGERRQCVQQKEDEWRGVARRESGIEYYHTRIADMWECRYCGGHHIPPERNCVPLTGKTAVAVNINSNGNA